jgi:hypothetical protein
MRQTHRAAVDERHAPAAAKDAEHGARLDDAQIAPQRQLETASNSVAADGRNPRLLGLEARRSERSCARRLQADRVVERTQIGARAKRTVGAGEHADMHRRVGVNGDHRLKERVGRRLVDRIACVQAINGDDGNTDGLRRCQLTVRKSRSTTIGELIDEQQQQSHNDDAVRRSPCACARRRTASTTPVSNTKRRSDTRAEFARALEADFKRRALAAECRATAGRGGTLSTPLHTLAVITFGGGDGGESTVVRRQQIDLKATTRVADADATEKAVV